DALALQLGPQLRIDQSKKNQAGLGFDVLERPLELALAAHERIEVLVDYYAFKLCQRRARDRI
ncbi:MAG TPA: hypothetical protein VJ476_01690, partial [Rhizomicrobium sp.]|nr:hypothetical protein [Rhizomicrobium sp.]